MRNERIEDRHVGGFSQLSVTAKFFLTNFDNSYRQAPAVERSALELG